MMSFDDGPGPSHHAEDGHSAKHLSLPGRTDKEIRSPKKARLGLPIAFFFRLDGVWWPSDVISNVEASCKAVKVMSATVQLQANTSRLAKSLVGRKSNHRLLIQ